WAILGFWVVEQAFLGLVGTPGIAISAHLGGFAAGVCAALLLKSPSLRDSLWYLDPQESTVVSRRERADARMWGAIADYHRGGRSSVQQRMTAPAQISDPYEKAALRRWNKGS